MSDADEPEPASCDTLSYENGPVEGGYCAECADISPDYDEPERVPTESGDSNADGSMEGRSGNTNPGFRAGESAVRDRSGREQHRAAVTTPQHAPDERGRKGRSR
jgi:hypothetical protein